MDPTPFCCPHVDLGEKLPNLMHRIFSQRRYILAELDPRRIKIYIFMVATILISTRVTRWPTSVSFGTRAPSFNRERKRESSISEFSLKLSVAALSYPFPCHPPPPPRPTEYEVPLFSHRFWVGFGGFCVFCGFCGVFTSSHASPQLHPAAAFEKASMREEFFFLLW